MPGIKHIFHLPFLIFHLSFPEIRYENGLWKMRKSKAVSQARADKLEERLIDFAVRIVVLSANLPKTPAGKHVAAPDLAIRNFTGTKLWRGQRGRKPR